MKKYLVLASLCVLYSCATHLVIPESFKTVKGERDVYVKPFIYLKKDSIVSYATEITTYGKYFNGVTYFKNMNDTLMRVVFTTHTGLKLFDFEFSQTDYKVKYIYEQMNNQAVINTLSKDFKLLTLWGQNPLDVVLSFYNNETREQILKVENDKDAYIYIDTLQQVKAHTETAPHTNKIHTMVQRQADSSVMLIHKNFKLELVFKPLKIEQ